VLAPEPCANGVRASNSPIAYRVRYISDSHDSDFAARSPDEPFYVVRVACENRSLVPEGCCHHNGVNHIRRLSQAQQPPCFVRIGLTKRDHHAPSQETPKLRLLWGPADLNDHRRGNQRNYARFQTDFVFGPRSPLASVRGHQNGSVVDLMPGAGSFATFVAALARCGELHSSLPR
jgi:hypothetical protein